MTGETSNRRTLTSVRSMFFGSVSSLAWLTPETSPDIGTVDSDIVVALAVGAAIVGVTMSAAIGALHRTFERTIEQLDALLERTRSLLVVDWHANREVSRIIRKAMRSAP